MYSLIIHLTVFLDQEYSCKIAFRFKESNELKHVERGHYTVLREMNSSTLYQGTGYLFRQDFLNIDYIKNAANLIFRDHGISNFR